MPRMRIAIVTRNGRHVGGAETYLSSVGRALCASGHDLALLHEVDVPADHAPLTIVDGIPRWCVADLGRRTAVDRLRRWAPDVIYAHGLADPAVEHAMLALAPVVFHAHNYHHGTCISGTKTFWSPGPRPCHRRFGAGCLALYYPRRCGGWHPRTMWREYRRQRRRQEFLEGCATIVASSRYLAAEYASHHLATHRIVALPLPIADVGDVDWTPPGDAGSRLRHEWRLLFLGRMDRLKGGEMLLRALPIVAAAARRPVLLTLAGDGPELERWRVLARDLEGGVAGLTVRFVGWAGNQMREALFKQSDLLVVPSVWPEPFGLVGLEAARYGVPAAAFDVGGIPEWLEDGIGGRLAAGDPPTAGGLAAAIVACLSDAQTYARLSTGAFATAVRFTRTGHTRELCRVLEDAAEWGRTPAVAER